MLTFQQFGVLFALHSLPGSVRKRGCYHWPVFGWLLGQDLGPFVVWVAHLESLETEPWGLISGRVYWDLYDMGVFLAKNASWFKKDGLPSAQ